MKVATGTVLDRPWGQTLGTVGVRKLTGQVSIRTEDGKIYAIGFVDGNVAAASSPLPNDSVTRVALTSHFVSPVQVGDITRRLANEKHRDEVDIVAEAGKLSVDHTMTLRRRLLIQRAARTFAVDRGEFDIDDELALPVHPGFGVALGAVIFQGVRMNLSDERLAQDLRELGAAFVLKPTTTDEDLARYELEVVTPHFLDALRGGATLAELEAAHRDIEPRTLHSVLYALVCGGLCEGRGGFAVDRTIPIPRANTTSIPPATTHTTIKIDQPLVTRTTRPSAVPANAPNFPAGTPRTVSMQGLDGTPPTDPGFAKPSVIDVTPRLAISHPASESEPTVSRTPSPSTPPAVSRTTSLTSPRTTTPTSAPAVSRTTSITSRTATPTSTPPTVSRTTSLPQTPPASRTTSLTQAPRSTTPTSAPRTITPRPTTGSPSNIPSDRTSTIPPINARQGSGSAPGFAAGDHITPALARTITAPRTITERERAAREIEALMAQRLAKLDSGCDYFAILGLPYEAPAEAVRNAYIETSRKLHPESLVQVGITDDARVAQRVMAQVNAAFTVLNDVQKRREYINAVRRGEPTPIAPRARTGELDKTELAAEAFALGETALKREDIPRAVEELGRAVTLAPTNFSYLAMFAWARFCATENKQSVYVETRKALEKAINRSDKPVTARFYLGRVERILGHDREAMNHFQEVLLDEPNNKEAASEVRFLEHKLAKGSSPKR